MSSRHATVEVREVSEQTPVGRREDGASPARQPGRSALRAPTGQVPVYVTRDRTLRVKITDACGMACTFCHNEGTPVVVDNIGRDRTHLLASGPSGRVSIYLRTNGASFLPAPVVPDREFAAALSLLRDALDLDELHLTGGEPTLHQRLPEIIRVARELGYRVSMTSNGENGVRVLPGCAEAGLDRVNFSIFGTTAVELAQVQHRRYLDRVRAARKIEALRRSVETALALHIPASANIVVPSRSHATRVQRLLDDHAEELSVRLLNSLDEGQASVDAILGILADLDAVPVARHLIAGTSGHRTAYRIAGGRIVYFKQIRPLRLPVTCVSCPFNNDTDCQEGFYGVRLYRDRAGGYLVGVCIRRMDLCMPVGDFVTSRLLNEIVQLRETDYGRLVAAAVPSV